MGDAFRIKITNGALADLEGIFDHVQTDSPQNAAGLIERILDDIDRLALLPTRHPVAGNSRRTGLPVYKLVVKPFLVYYRVDLRRKALFVMEVRHGAMRQPTRFDRGYALVRSSTRSESATSATTAMPRKSPVSTIPARDLSLCSNSCGFSIPLANRQS